MEIKLSELIGKNTVSMEQGRILYTVLIENIEKEDVISIDFSDLSVIASPFFNASISLLLKDHSISYVLDKVKMVEIPDYAKSILNESFSNAVNYYKK
jgi:hypothetical protein